MSKKELERAKVLGRVKSQTLRLVDATAILQVKLALADRITTIVAEVAEYGSPKLYRDTI